MRTTSITPATPLTDRERSALARLRAQGPQIVGQTVVLNTSTANHLRRCDVFTGVAKGLHRRGLVNLSRPDKRGPLVMTLKERT